MNSQLMNSQYLNYDDGPKCEQVGQQRSFSQREILVEKLNHLNKQVEQTQAALDFFDKNPTFEQGLDILCFDFVN
jgi:hypothetical protein